MMSGALKLVSQTCDICSEEGEGKPPFVKVADFVGIVGIEYMA